MLSWQVFAALLCVAYSRDHANKHKHSVCSRGFKKLDTVCLKTYHYATDYDTAYKKCRHHGSHLIRGNKEELNKMVKKMQTKKMIENTKYWTSSYDLDENSVWFHRFDPKDFAMVMSVDGKNIEERVQSRSRPYRFICQQYPRHGKKHFKSKLTEWKEKESSRNDHGNFEQEKEQTNVEVKEILSEGQIVNELGFEDDEPSILTDSEASDLSSQQSSEASDLSSQLSSKESGISSEQSSEASDLSSQHSSEASDLSSQQSSEASDLSSQPSSEASDLSSHQILEASDISSQQSSEESELNSEQSTHASSEFEEIEEESDANLEDRLSEEQWGEQPFEDHKIAEDLDEQTPEDDGPEEPAEGHGAKQHGESSSATAILSIIFLFPLVYIVLCILN